jgi:HAD superfamily hydrolase (TIGR01509 family)
MTSPNIRAIVFDLGETLVNETRFWSSVAAYAGVPELTLHGVLGGLIERREHFRSLFNVMQIESVDPNVIGYRIEARDLYPDVVPTLKRLSHEGFALGVTGNQPAGVIEQVAALGLPLTLNATSTSWGVSKPDPAFFHRMATELDMEPGEVMYIGDRIDNDILPAQEVGMRAVFIRRGPWGYLHTAWPEMEHVGHQIDSLGEVPDLVQRLNRDAK